jgi:3-oxoacyl-[acyl-carrier-protein] synthase II
VVSGRKALIQAGLDKDRNPEGHAKLDVSRVGVLIGTGMGGLTVFQDGMYGDLNSHMCIRFPCVI